MPCMVCVRSLNTCNVSILMPFRLQCLPALASCKLNTSSSSWVAVVVAAATVVIDVATAAAIVAVVVGEVTTRDVA